MGFSGRGRPREPGNSTPGRVSAGAVLEELKLPAQSPKGDDRSRLLRTAIKTAGPGRWWCMGGSGCGAQAGSIDALSYQSLSVFETTAVTGA